MAQSSRLYRSFETKRARREKAEQEIERERKGFMLLSLSPAPSPRLKLSRGGGRSRYGRKVENSGPPGSGRRFRRVFFLTIFFPLSLYYLSISFAGFLDALCVLRVCVCVCMWIGIEGVLEGNDRKSLPGMCARERCIQ